MKKILNYILFKDYELSLPLPLIGNVIAIITAISVCSLVSGFLFMVPGKHNIYYIMCAISLLYLVFNGGFRLNKLMLFFYAVIVINVMFLPILPLFRSQMRAANFIFVTLVCSPAIMSKTAAAYRERVFKYVLIGFTILTVLSFFCFFLGINMMPFNREGSMALYDDYQNVGGKFSGLFNHSMIFGPIAALVSLVNFNLYLKYRTRIRLVLFFLCSMACVFSASRAALLALAFGIAAVLYKAIKTPHSYISFKRVTWIFIFVGLATLPFADVAFSGVLNKMDITQEEFGGYSSRDRKYERRLYEFSESPILGVGFASIDIRTGDAYSPYTGQIEPGTAHLAVLAQTGLVGMTAYVLFLLGALKALRRRNSMIAYTAYALFWLFFGHGWAEGWIFAPGGMICFMFWLSMAQCYDIEYKESYKCQLE